MDYDCGGKRKTKGDLKKKRLNRAYKRGGQFRTMNVAETDSSEDAGSKGDDTKGSKSNKKKNKKNRKY